MKIKIKRSQAMSLNATSALQKAAKKTQTYCPSVHDHEVDTSIHNHTDETFSTEQNLHTIAQEAYMINCESMNYELKEDESDFFNADTISQSSTKPDECWDHPRKNNGED